MYRTVLNARPRRKHTLIRQLSPGDFCAFGNDTLLVLRHKDGNVDCWDGAIVRYINPDHGVYPLQSEPIQLNYILEED